MVFKISIEQLAMKLMQGMDPLERCVSAVFDFCGINLFASHSISAPTCLSSSLFSPVSLFTRSLARSLTPAALAILYNLP